MSRVSSLFLNVSRFRQLALCKLWNRSFQIRILIKKAIDVLYRIGTLSGKERNPLLALEGILDEVMNTLEQAVHRLVCSMQILINSLLKLRGLSKSSKEL